MATPAEAYVVADATLMGAPFRSTPEDDHDPCVPAEAGSRWIPNCFFCVRSKRCVRQPWATMADTSLPRVRLPRPNCVTQLQAIEAFQGV